MVGAIIHSAQQSLTILFLMGFGFYLLDRQPVWQAIYRWIHDFFHRAANAMPKDKVRGLFYGQLTQTKVIRIGIASTLLFVVQVYEAKLSVNLAAEVIVWVLGVPAGILGIILGYFAQEKLFPNKSKYFDLADRASEQLAHASIAGAAGAVKDLGSKVSGTVFSRIKDAMPQGKAPEATTPVKPEAPKEDPRATLKRILEN